MEKIDQEYNNSLNQYANNYRALNHFVMSHTYERCKNEEILNICVETTKNGQIVIYDKDIIVAPKDGPTTNIIISNKRTLEAARPYMFMGKKVAVLNFANNHSIGGSPYSAGAQEESLCRCSTLYPCLEKEKETFYDYHRKLYEQGVIDEMGNNDIIYSPLVNVFKTDESAPKMMERKDWYLVDVITCAAPQLYGKPVNEEDYLNNIILPRLRRVFQIAKFKEMDALVLGAWGCGAFGNPPELIAKAFKILCGEYHFDTIEFAIDASRKPSTNYDAFMKVFGKA